MEEICYSCSLLYIVHTHNHLTCNLYLQMAMFYPSIIFGVCFILNFFVWGKHSSGAVCYIYIFTQISTSRISPYISPYILDHLLPVYIVDIKCILTCIE